MARSGVDEDNIGGTKVESAAIAVNNLDLTQMSKIGFGPWCELVVDLYSGDVPGRANHMRQDSSVVSGTAAHVYDVLTALKVEVVEPTSKSTWLAIVQEPLRKNSDQNIIVKMSRIGIGCRSIPAAAQL